METKLELTYSQKLELAKWIADKNCGVITGSIMLKERGIDLGREVGDIDILVESTSHKDIVLPPLFIKGEEGEDNDGYTVLARAWYLGNKIEFITVEDLVYDTVKGVRLAKIKDLIEAKEDYIKTSFSPEYIEKSKKDLDIIKKWNDDKHLLNN